MKSQELLDVWKRHGVHLGGSSFGKGLTKAAHYYIQRQQQQQHDDDGDVEDEVYKLNYNPPVEDPFYVVDVGVLLSQYYQWRRFLPRVRPYYAVKCNPHPLILETLTRLGCGVDVASRAELDMAHTLTSDIIFANPCKPPSHIAAAVRKGVTLMTFDNVAEVQKCAAISLDIQLVLRIATDDRGSQCRFSSKFGSTNWMACLEAAKNAGLDVVGVSFHVGSGCRDATKYELALQNSRRVFDMAKREFGYEMYLLDIGGGFPGETHGIWNPSETIDVHYDNQEEDVDSSFMCFTEIAESIAPIIDQLFPPSVQVIAEPGRYFTAASATLCASVIAKREVPGKSTIEDAKAAQALDSLTRKEEDDILHGTTSPTKDIPWQEFTSRHTNWQLVQQEFDVYNDPLDLYTEGLPTARDLLGPPEEDQYSKTHHTAEGMRTGLVQAALNGDSAVPTIDLAAAGEAAVQGLVAQALIEEDDDIRDEVAYYVNDGVYGAFNNLMFDHATVRPRVLSQVEEVSFKTRQDGLIELQNADSDVVENGDDLLSSSTVFGPTCDAIDVIARSILLPNLKVGDRLYFQNMGAYTMAAASSFNGFQTSPSFLVCSIPPEYYDTILDGPQLETGTSEKYVDADSGEEKKVEDRKKL